MLFSREAALIMSFNEKLYSLSKDEIVNILNIAGIETVKVYANRIQCSCPSREKACIEYGKCSYYFNSARVECLNTAHGGTSLYTLLQNIGIKNPFSLFEEEKRKKYKAIKPIYLEQKDKERSYIIQKDLMKILEDTDDRWNEIVNLLSLRHFDRVETEALLDLGLIHYLTKETKQNILKIKNGSDKTYKLGFPARDKQGHCGYSMWIGDYETSKYNSKYKYTEASGIVLYDQVLNYEDPHKRLFVVEGIFDLLKLIAMMKVQGYDLPYGIISIPSKGRISNTMMYTQCDHIFIFTDQDTAGKQFILNNIKEIKNKKVFTAQWNVKKYKAKGLDEFLQQNSYEELKKKIRRII